MGFLDELKKMTRPYDDEDDFYEDEEEAIPVAEEAPEPERPCAKSAPAPKKSSFISDSTSQAERPVQQAYAPKRETRAPEKVVNLNTGSQLKVVLVKPDRFESAAEIADHLRDRRAVLINLEQTNKDIARRLIDFLSGVAYAQDGKIRRIATATYIITPFNVDLMGDQLDEMESGEFRL